MAAFWRRGTWDAVEDSVDSLLLFIRFEALRERYRVTFLGVTACSEKCDDPSEFFSFAR